MTSAHRATRARMGRSTTDSSSCRCRLRRCSGRRSRRRRARASAVVSAVWRCGEWWRRGPTVSLFTAAVQPCRPFPRARHVSLLSSSRRSSPHRRVLLLTIDSVVTANRLAARPHGPVIFVSRYGYHTGTYPIT